MKRNRQGVETMQTEFPALSGRELQVLRLMATPLTYKEISEQLYISEETVMTYVKPILTKLDELDQTQAVIARLCANLISID